MSGPSDGARLKHLISGLATRFPVPVLSAILGTAIWFATEPLWFPAISLLAALDASAGQLMLACVIAFFASFTAALAGEAHGWSRRRTQAVSGLVGLASFVLAAFLERVADLNAPILLYALVLLLGVIPNLRPGSAEGRYWAFNHDLWTGAVMALVGAMILAAGVAAILRSLEFLFGVEVSSLLYRMLWILSVGIVAPLGWLGHAPSADDPALAAPQRDSLLSRAIGTLVGYVLAPLLMAYALVLHVYAAKIGLEGVLPQGQLGWMVMSFGACLTLTTMLAYPSRDDGGSAVRLYWRIWPWLLVVPCGLLFVAILTRLGEYGLTEDRYLVLVAGLWFASLVLTQGVLAGGRDIRFLPSVFGTLLLAASFGPWGASGWSQRSQAAAFAARLEAVGLAVDGRIVSPRPDKILLQADERRLHDIIQYLDARHRLDLVAPVFAGIADDPFQGGAPSSEVIKKRLGLAAGYVPPSQVFSFYSTGTADLAREGPQRLVGPLALWASRGSPPATREVAFDGGTLKVVIEKGVVAIQLAPDGRTALFDLTALPELEAAQRGKGPAPGELKPLVLKRTSGDLDADIVLMQANGPYVGDEKTVAIESVNIWLVLGAAKGMR